MGGLVPLEVDERLAGMRMTDEGPLRIDLTKVPSGTPAKVKLLRGLWGLFQIPFWRHMPKALSPVRIALLKLFGAQRIAFGSDYPFPLGEAHPGQLIDSMEELSPEDKAQLLSGTAREFLGL